MHLVDTPSPTLHRHIPPKTLQNLSLQLYSHPDMNHQQLTHLPSLAKPHQSLVSEISLTAVEFFTNRCLQIMIKESAQLK